MLHFIKVSALTIFLLPFILIDGIYSQTLVSFYSFPYATVYNTFWGVTQRNDTLWIGSDNYGKLYRVTKTGVIRDSITTPFDFNHGLVWDGSGFWIAEDYRTSGGRIYKVNLSGVVVDSILTGSFAQGIGGIALDGNFLWAAVYYPDFTSYPFAYAYKFNLTTKQVVDTIPLRGKQVQGITVKGDTILYVTDNFQSEPERIYAYRKAVGDTLFSFPAPDPDNDCDPKGLFWDGQNLWLIAYRIGNNISAYRNLYKYTLTGQGSPQISTSANSVNFGNVIIGTTGNQMMSISNTGSARLIVSSFTMTNPRFSITPNIVPDTINVSQSKNYTLGFSPIVFDTTSGELRIASNDVGTPVKVVNLRGKGIFSGSQINVSVSNFNYGVRRVNSLCGFTFDVSNPGSQPLVINSVTFSSQRFKFDNTNVTFPATIDTQRSRTFRIWFNPNAAAAFSDSAVINSNAANNPALKIHLSGSGQSVLTDLGDIFWEGNIPANPNTTNQDYQPVSIKQIGDVNNDGINDVIVATQNYWTICYNGNSSVTADTLWKFNTHFGSINTGSVDWEDALQIIPDINSDGAMDVVIGCGGGNEMVYAISGRTGAKLWEYGSPTTTNDGDIEGVRTDKDFNGDGRKDVLVSASGVTGGSGGRHAAICLNGLNGQVIFNVTQPEPFTDDIVATQTGGAIGVNNNLASYKVNGFNNNGQNVWTYTMAGVAWSLKEIPDINNDGNKDIVGLFGFSGGLFAITGNTGQQIWSNNFGASNNGKVILLDDKDKNGFADISTSGPQVVYRMDSRVDSVLWSAPLGSSYIRGIDDIGDVSGDTLHDVAVMTQLPGKLVILDGKNGSSLFEYVFGTTINQRGDRVSALASIDSNLSNEIVAGSRDGRIKCFSGGQNTVIGISGNNKQIPAAFALYQNYPNPFNPVTKIKFDVPAPLNPPEGGTSAMVILKIYDVLGREVAVLLNQEMKPGRYELRWDAVNFASGIYFYELRTGTGFRDIKKMTLVK
jgi:hypothetical protein